MDPTSTTVSPRVTVLIDTYNYGRFIGEAIDSVLSQDFPMDQAEVLVVDDGSTDDTAEQVRKYGERVKYLYKENGGQASALNLGIARARGEIICLLDADDLFLPGKLARITQAFQKDASLGLVYHRMQEWHTDSNERRNSDFVPISGDMRTAPDSFFFYVPYPTSCLSFRRSCLTRLLPIPEGLRTQADGYLGSLILFVAPVLAIPECLATYRLHGKNLYQPNPTQTSLEVAKNRVPVRRILVEGMRNWLAANGFTRRRPAVRSFLDRWTLYQESNEFLLKPPGRFRFFRHLLLYNRCYSPHMSWRLRLINYFNAFASLISGYKRFPLLK